MGLQIVQWRRAEALEQIVLRRSAVGTPSPFSRAVAVSIQHVTSRDETKLLSSPPRRCFPRRKNAFSSPGYTLRVPSQSLIHVFGGPISVWSPSERYHVRSEFDMARPDLDGMAPGASSPVVAMEKLNSVCVE